MAVFMKQTTLLSTSLCVIHTQQKLMCLSLSDALYQAFKSERVVFWFMTF